MATPKKIAACIGVLCEAFNRKPTAVVFKAYEIAFNGISDDLLDSATNAALTNAGDFMPPPGKLRELAVTGGIGYEARAERAWLEFDKAVSRHGADSSVSFEDGLINATVRLCGDWVPCCNRIGDDYAVWLRRQFMETYSRLCTGGASESLRQPLMGALWRENQMWPDELLKKLPRVNTGQVVSVGTSQPVLLPPSEAPKPIAITERPSSLPMVEYKKAN